MRSEPCFSALQAASRSGLTLCHRTRTKRSKESDGAEIHCTLARFVAWTYERRALRSVELRRRELQHEARERALALVQRHGWNATAFQTLEDGYSYFFHRDDACVAYVDTGAAWVAAGAPIADPRALAEVATAFVRAARASGRRSCFFSTEDRFRAAAAPDFRTVQIGEQPVWDPHEWADTVTGHRSLREQLRRARAKGVRIREMIATELGPERDGMRRVTERWLAAHGMAPMGFLVSVDMADLHAHRMSFIATIGDRVVAFASVIPVPARDGWFVEHLIRDPMAPNGTAELLIDSVMRWAAGTGRRWLTLGLSPLAGPVPGALRLARRFSTALYDFEGLRRYRAKLRPRSWSAIHLSYPATQAVSVTLVDALAAFTRGGFLRFGLQSLVRGPPAVLSILALLLVPWTIVLALAPAERWFGAASVKWAWVLFDVILAVGLWRLVARPRPEKMLLDVLAIAVTTDALVTLGQALAWNVHHTRSLAEALVVLVGCAAPAFAAVILWGAWTRSRRIHHV